MKSFVIACLLVVAASASSYLDVLEQGAKFQTFKLEHGKTYQNQAEEATRFNIFRENLREIEEHNALYDLGLKTFRKAVTKFTDMTREEIKAFLTLQVKPTLTRAMSRHVPSVGGDKPKSVDWRKKGAVTAVKNQENCGSCWAFALTGTTEAAYQRKTGKLVSLSEQQLVDCTTDVNAGCGGGRLEQNFDYIQENGLQTEESYPYDGYDDDCRYNSSNVVTHVSGYKTMSGDEDALLDAVSNVGPCAVAVDATDFTFYGGGILTPEYCSPSGLNHGVLVVGFGEEEGVKYWIIKNSWGTGWGEHGYVRLLRGKDACGVAQDTTYPTV